MFRVCNSPHITGIEINIKLGQIARYIDDCHCRYGVVSTYRQTVFVKQNGDYTFARSQVITASMRALDRVPPVVSAKEAMLYMAYLAGNRFGDAAYPVRIGDRLVRCISNDFI